LGPATGTSDETVRNRLRMLMAVDEGVGRIFEALVQAGKLDRTLILFTSDHGYFYGEHGLSVERRLAYEEAIRIPLLMRYPRLIPAGLALDPMVLGLDLAPSLLEIGGAPIPGDVQGRSLVPLLEGRTWTPRRSFLIEYFSDNVFPRVRNMGYHAIRTERWKYISYKELAGMDEFYDLESDPFEMRNLVDEPAAQSELAERKAELRRLLDASR
jgi:N-acetylglucosamine-6-sulfatase